MSRLSQTNRLKTFGDVATGIAAAGTTQATAATLVSDHCTVATGSEGVADGVIMKAGNTDSFRTVTNKSTAAIKLYPPVGSNFNGGTTNGAINLNPNRAAWLFFITSTDISAIAW